MRLFTKEIDKQLFAQYSKGSDLENQMVVAKIFNPYGRGTWYLLNSDPEDPDYIWAIVDLFEVEMGSVSRSELESIKVPPFNLGFERDLYFEPVNAAELYKGLLEGKIYKKGGATDNGNAEMLRSNAKAISHHAKELQDTAKGKDVEAWVVAKSERAATDLSDVTHYLDGKEYANGGRINEKEKEIEQIEKAIVETFGFDKEDGIDINDLKYIIYNARYQHLTLNGRFIDKTRDRIQMSNEFDEISTALEKRGWKIYNQYSNGGYMKKGGSTDVYITNEMRGEDNDEYGTFELFKRGGKVEVKILNRDEAFSKSKYEWLLGDFDKDGLANVDDKSPYDADVRDRIDSPSIEKGVTSILDLKNTMDKNMYSFVDDLKNISPDNSKIYARTKTPYSIIDKLIKKRLLNPKTGLTDLIGTTIVTNDKKELDGVKKVVESGKLGRVIELEDMYANPKQGYRAYHFLVEKNGMPIELQLKTKRQKALNELSHEPYKLGKLDSDKLIQMTEVANQADNGNKEAIEEYNEFMKQPDLEKVFYKYADGGWIGSYKKPIKISEVAEFLENTKDDGHKYSLWNKEIGITYSYNGKLYANDGKVLPRGTVLELNDLLKFWGNKGIDTIYVEDEKLVVLPQKQDKYNCYTTGYDGIKNKYGNEYDVTLQEALEFCWYYNDVRRKYSTKEELEKEIKSTPYGKENIIASTNITGVVVYKLPVQQYANGGYMTGGGVGEPYDSMTKYQIEKEYKKLNEKRDLLKKKYGTFQSDEVVENEKEIDKIITLLYGKNFSGEGQKFKYANGGYMAGGGKIKDQYEGREAEDIWNNLSKMQRQHFLYDHASEIEDYRGEEFGELKSSEIIKAYNSDFSNLDKHIRNRFENHVRQGQYAKGGYMARGGNIPSIEKKVEEVNRLIKLGNDNNLTVVDASNTWQAPMKYKPFKYSNGVLYEEYEELDLYSYNKGMGKKWNTKKDKILKANMQYDSPLNQVAKMYRKALKDAGVVYADGGYMAKGGEIEKRLKFVNDYYKSEVKDAKKRGNYYGYTQERITKGYYKDLKQAQKGKEFDNFLLEEAYQVQMNNKILAEGGMMAKGGIVVTSIKDIPNFTQRLEEGKITYRGLGMGKIANDFYKLAGTSGTRIKVDGKEYYITDEEFATFSRDANGKMRIRFDAPKRKFEDGGKVGFSDKVKAIKQSLLKRKKVSPKVQKDYGKTYSPKEAEDSAKRIVGAMTASERLKSVMKKRKK